MKKKEPDVSVIMGIYNQKNYTYLDKAISSVLQQTFTDLELIIYDDGSDDEVAEQLHRYEQMDERVVLISNPVNHGLAYSLNTCIDVARGKYLARMDDDDICMGNRFQIQFDFLEHHPEFAFVGCNAMLLDDGGVWGVRKMPPYPDRQDFLKYSPYIHPTVMIRRQVFEEGNSYSAKKQNWRCEDYELFMRLYQLGYQGCNLQQELFYYREDRNSYEKRKPCYRFNELKLRYANFKELGILFPFGWLYVLRPLMAAAFPPEMIWGVKKLYHKQDMVYENRIRREEMQLHENFEKNPTVV